MTGSPAPPAAAAAPSPGSRRGEQHQQQHSQSPPSKKGAGNNCSGSCDDGDGRRRSESDDGGGDRRVSCYGYYRRAAAAGGGGGSQVRAAGPPPPMPPKKDPGAARLDLLRLLHVMEAAEQESEGKEEEEEGRQQGSQGRLASARADRLLSLWRDLPETDRAALPDLERRIALRVRRHGASSSLPASAAAARDERDDDPVRRIFFPGGRRRGGAATDEAGDGHKGESRSAASLQGGPTAPASPAPDAPLPPPALRSRRATPAQAGGASSAAPPPPPPPAAARSVRELQDDQRDQTEAAISSMASQLKGQTRRIHDALRVQNLGLDEVGAAAASNAEGVGALARDAAAHARRGWSRTLGTWAVLLGVAGAFVGTCLVIAMVPKRPGACLLFCPPARPPGIDDDNAATVCRDVEGRRVCVPVREALESWYGLRQRASSPGSGEAEDEKHRVGSGDGSDLHGPSWGGCSAAHGPNTEGGAAPDEAAREAGTCGAGGGGDLGHPQAVGAEEPRQEDAETRVEAATAGARASTEVPEMDRPESSLARSGAEGFNAGASQRSEGARRDAGGAPPETQEVPVATDGEEVGGGGTALGKEGDGDGWEAAALPTITDVEEKDHAEAYAAPGGAEGPSAGASQQGEAARGAGVAGDDGAHEMREVSVAVDGEVGGWVEDDEDGGWDLPPVPDADDVLREYMENYRAEVAAAEAHDGGGDSDDEDDGGDDRGDDGTDAAGVAAADAGGEAALGTEESEGAPPPGPFSPSDVRLAAERGDAALLDGYLASEPRWADEADHNSWSGLHLAARAGHLEAVRVLLRRGASPAARTASGDTPLSVAEAYLGPDHPVTLLLLRSSGGGVG